MAKYKILIDTDLGADVDDQLALYAAILDKNVEIVGVTTVCGNVKERAKEVKKIFNLTNNSSIPVYFGKTNGMSKDFNSQKHLLTYQEDLENPLFQPNNNDENEAISFIVDMAKKYQDELYILAIGPATNIAYAIKKDLKAMQSIKGLYMMGGCTFTNRVEWNVFCDPKAFQVVVESNLPFYLITKECTEKTKVSTKQCQEILNLENEDGILKYLGFSARKWVEFRNVGITLHDVLAFYAIVHPEYLSFVEQRIACEVESKLTSGMIVNYSINNLYPKDCGNKVFVSNYVNAKKFVLHFMKSCIRHKG